MRTPKHVIDALEMLLKGERAAPERMRTIDWDGPLRMSCLETIVADLRQLASYENGSRNEPEQKGDLFS